VTEKKETNWKQVLIIGAAVLVVILIVAGVFFLRKTGDVEEKPTIGQIDRDKVLDTKEFKEANEKIKNLTKEYEKKFEEETKNLNERNEADQAKVAQLRMQYQQELMNKTNQIINPLWDKAATAVAVVAVKKNMNTVLDKKIVVCGANDITEDVVALLSESKKLEKPEEKAQKALEEKSKIGYFDKNVVMSLNLFNDAEARMQEIEKQARAEFEKASKDMGDEQKSQMALAYMEKIQKTREDLYAPLFRQVNRTVKKVAQDDKLDLVVNKENVMYGGHNITDKVADELSGKKGGK
jgi:outer membrane protein